MNREVRIVTGAGQISMVILSGSAADDPSLYMRTPYDLGWGGMVNFNHDFVARPRWKR